MADGSMRRLPRRLESTAALVILLLFIGSGAAAQPPGEPEMRPLEERLARALVTKDKAAFDELLDPGFVLRGTPDLDRAAWIASALTLCWGETATITELKVIDADSGSAVVALMLITDRDPETCERATVRSLITDVWRRRQGRWRLALRHSGPAGSVGAQFAREAAPPARWAGTAELSLVDTGGNTDTQTLGATATLVWRPGGWTSEARTSFIRSITQGVVSTRVFSAALRQSRTISDRVDAFGRLDYLANEFAGIDHRVSLDAGLGYRVLTGPAHVLRGDAGFGYSHEARLGGDDRSFAQTTIGGAYTWQVARHVSLTENALLTASLQDAEDWRFRSALAIAASLTRLLAVKLSHELTFVNAPAAGFEGRDTILAAALVLRF